MSNRREFITGSRSPEKYSEASSRCVCVVSYKVSFLLEYSIEKALEICKSYELLNEQPHREVPLNKNCRKEILLYFFCGKRSIGTLDFECQIGGNSSQEVVVWKNIPKRHRDAFGRYNIWSFFCWNIL